MATGQLSGVLDTLRRTARLGDSERMSDADLLNAFIASGEEAAFEGLVRRHGPMVLGVCRRILANTHDAEDAFQAAFLVLATKAPAVTPRAMVGNWLYGVACRTALKAKSMIAKRSAREKQLTDLPERALTPPGNWTDVQPLIDLELNRLSDKYRVPVVLCDLEGKSQRDAAKQLGWPEGTLMTRLSRARAILAKRLTSKGVALSAATLAALFAHNAVSASVPASLAVSTVKAAALTAAGHAAALVSAEVAALTEGVLQAMFITKIKSAVIVLLALAVLTTGGGFFTHWSLTDQSIAGERRATNTPAPAAVEQDREGRGNPATLNGKVVSVAKDGKSITVETPPPARGDAPANHDIKLTDKSELLFFGVGPDNAKLAAGMLAQIWIADGAKDIAAKVHLMGKNDGRMAPDFVGKVVSISKDGTTLTFDVRGARGARGIEAKTIEIKLTIKTALTYSNVSKGEAKLTDGYLAEVWLERGSKTDAVAISFRGGEEQGRGRIVNRSDRAGKVVGLSKDGKLITVELPAKDRGGEAERVSFKLDDKTRITYHNISPNGDTPTEGYLAQIALVEGSKDTAAAVNFMAPHKDRLQVVRGPVVAVAKDGKSFTIETPGGERGAAPVKTTVQITEHTKVVYNGVGPNGARLTEGLAATVHLDEGSPSAAFQIVFGRVDAGSRR